MMIAFAHVHIRQCRLHNIPRRLLHHHEVLTEYNYRVKVPLAFDKRHVILAVDKAVDDALSLQSDPLEEIKGYESQDDFLDVIRSLSSAVVSATLGSFHLQELKKPIIDLQIDSEYEHYKLGLLCLQNKEYVKACAVWEAGLLANPKDSLAIRCAQVIYELLGDRRNVLGVVERVLPNWSPADAGYSRLLAMHGYGQQIVGNVLESEETFGRALNISLDNVLAIYGLVQAYERSCRHREGLRVLKELEESYITGSPLRNRLIAYRGIFQSQLGEYDIALHLLDTEIPRSSVVEQISLLWRLGLYGVKDDEESLLVKKNSIKTKENSFFGLLNAPVDIYEDITIKSRYNAVLESIQPKLELLSIMPLLHMVQYSYGDWIFETYQAMGFAAIGDKAGVLRIISQLQLLAKTDELEETDVSNSMLLNLSDKSLDYAYAEHSASMALLLCKAFNQYMSNEHEEVVKSILPIRQNLHLLGAGYLETDVFEYMFLCSLARSAGIDLDNDLAKQTAKNAKNLALAKALCCERTYRKHLCPQSWMLYAKVLKAAGDEPGSEAAYRRALDLGMGHGGGSAN